MDQDNDPRPGVEGLCGAHVNSQAVGDGANVAPREQVGRRSGGQYEIRLSEESYISN